MDLGRKVELAPSLYTAMQNALRPSFFYDLRRGLWVSIARSLRDSVRNNLRGTIWDDTVQRLWS